MLRISRRLGFGVIFGLILLGAALAIARFEYRNFHEYCHTQDRYLSDKELIDAAVQYEITHLSSSYVGQNGKTYQSVAEFHQVNPVCCQLNKSIPPRRIIWLRRIIGDYFLVVELWYKFIDEGSNRFTMANYLVDTCGNIRSAGTGGYANLSTAATPIWAGTKQ